jgi:hypothetical protein
MSETELHPSIVALVSLAADIASNHPKQGLCKIDRLKQYGVPRQHIETVVEIARHIRDEAAQKLDISFDLALAERLDDVTPAQAQPEQSACCTPTASGQSCC